MEMNDPAYLSTRSGPWIQAHTEHFDFYFFEGIDSVFAEEVKASQEANYARIVKFMGLEDDGDLTRIRFWLFRDKAEKVLKTKVSSDAHALPPYTSVYHLPGNATGGQEVGHILTISEWGFIPNSNGFSLLIDEGFNFYIDEKDYWVGRLGFAPFDSVSTQALSSKEHCERFTISHLAYEGEDKDWATDQAQVCGAFVKFLINTYGVNRFSEVWRKSVGKKKTDIEVFEQVYGKPLKQLEQEFYSYLGLDSNSCKD